MGRRGEDPMSGLLSSVGGIDSSLFQKPQSMRDMRFNQSSPVNNSPLPPPASRPQQGAPSSYASGQSFTSSSYKNPPDAISPRPVQAQVPSSKGQPIRDTNSQLDALLAGELSSKRSRRPMREASKLLPAKQEPENAPQPMQQPTASATSPPLVTSPLQTAVHEDLDSVFGPSSQSITATHSQPAAQSDDPFALFGGLGITEQAVNQTRQQRNTDNDFLGSFSSGLGTATSKQPQPVSEVASPTSVQSHQSVASFGGSGDWGGMMGAATDISSPNARAASSQQDFVDMSSSSPSFAAAPRGRHLHPDREQGSRSSADGLQPEMSAGQQSAATELPDAPPPSYESVTRSRGLASPRARLHAQHSANKYQAYRDDDAKEAGASPRQQRPPSERAARRATSSETAQQHRAARERQQQGSGDVKDQAKQWLSAGQKWLSGAGKKVAQAVKETQAQINSKLDDLEGRPAQGNSGRRTEQQAPSRQRLRTDVNSLEDVPQYYFEWAATIEALPQHEQGSTLAAIPDEDARTIQRILRHRAKRRSFEQTENAMMAEAQRRSLSEERILPRSQPDATSRRTRSSELSTPPSAEDTAASWRGSDRSGRPKSASEKNMGTHARPKPAKAATVTHQLREQVSDLMGLHEDPYHQPSPSPAPPSSAQADGSNDLMGLHGHPSVPQAESGPSVSPAFEHDILGFSEQPIGPQGPASASLDNSFISPQPSRSQATSPDLDELFGNKPLSTSTKQAPKNSQRLDSMIDFGDEARVPGEEGNFPVSAYDQEQEGEPEARKIARRRRLAEMHARMQKQLDEKLARDSAEQQTQEAQHNLRNAHKQRIDAWKSNKKDNIRALLSTLHTVLWEDSGWVAPGMTDLVEPARVKRAYMKANLVVHPDKVKQKGGTVEQVVVADMAFDTLKTAWSKFEASELRGR